MDPVWSAHASETLQFRCSFCGAGKDVKCSVHVPSQVKWQGYSQPYLVVPEHTRTAKTPHQARWDALRRKERRQAETSQVPVMSTAAHSYGQAAQDEYRQMRDWLRDNHQLFGLRRPT